MSARKTILLEVQKLKTLPALSAQTERLLAIIHDDNVTLEVLARHLEKLPAVAARLMGLSNSAFFGRTNRVETIRQALLRLGLSLVKSLTTGMLLADAFDTAPCPSFRPDRFWFTSVITAHLAKDLAPHMERTEPIDPALAYTAGLVANLGLLAVVHALPQVMNRVLTEAAQENRSIRSVMREGYETDYLEAGAWLAVRWQLPDVLRTVMGHHRDTEYQGPHRNLIQLVDLCRSAAEVLFVNPDEFEDTTGMATQLGISRRDLQSSLDRSRSQRAEISQIASILANDP